MIHVIDNFYDDGVAMLEVYWYAHDEVLVLLEHRVDPD